MSTNLLSKVIQFAPGPVEQLTVKMAEKSKKIMLYTSHKNQILLPENGDLLALFAYFKLYSIPYKICEICNGEDMSPDGVMPFIKDENDKIVCGYKAIIESIQSQRGLKSAADDFELMVKLSAFQMRLHNSEENFLWNNDEVYKNLTYQFYSYAKPWPVGNILSWLKR